MPGRVCARVLVFLIPIVLEKSEEALEDVVKARALVRISVPAFLHQGCGYEVATEATCRQYVSV